MWTQRHAALLDVDVAAERERVLARRADTFRYSEARKLLSFTGWPAERDRIEDLSRTKHAHLPPAERREIVTRALELIRQEHASQPEGGRVSNVDSGARLTPEQREQVRAFVRRELGQDPTASATEVRKNLEAELGIGLNHSTFHTVYWSKVRTEMQDGATPAESAADVSPRVVGSAQSGDMLPAPVRSAPEEQLSIMPGPDGQWRVQVQVLTSRAQALRLMQTVVGVLAADE